MKKELLNILCCPFDNSDFTVSISVQNNNEISNGTLTCNKCGKEFLIKDKPNFVSEKIEHHNPHDSRLNSLVNKIKIKPIKIFKEEEKILSHSGSKEVICEIGSGNRRLKSNVINLDLFDYAPVDIVCDIHRLPVKDSSLDKIFLIAVLEHIKNPITVLNECARVLKKNGKIFVDIPFMQPFHADPFDYQRYTLVGLKHLLRGFKEIKSGISIGPASTFHYHLSFFFASFFNNNLIHKVVRYIVSVLSSPILLLDYILIKRKNAFKTAFGFYYYGEKI